jgi:uncharacterized protein (TIGR03086 family)
MALMSDAAEEFARIVGLVPTEAWSRPTPLHVTVRELVEHVVVGNRWAVSLLQGMDPTDARAQLSADRMGTDPTAEAIRSGARQAAAFARTPPDQPLLHPSGEISATFFERLRLIELVVHGWDLLRSAEIDETLAPVVVEQAWTTLRPDLPKLLAFGAYGDGPSGTVPETASAQAKLLDAFGRRP